MQVILDIKANHKDIVLNIIKNLKEGIIKNYTVSSTDRPIIESVSLQEEQEIKDILNSMTPQEREISDIRKYSIEL
ncbi:MAG: hypothetical protein U9N49_09920 [Campylobacterota bacterium]|nr:hypothetical protein [Campylobacterota bacterium]